MQREGHNEPRAVEPLSRERAKKVIVEALDDWWQTHDKDAPGQELVSEIMGALTLAKIIEAKNAAIAALPAAQSRDEGAAGNPGEMPRDSCRLPRR